MSYDITYMWNPRKKRVQMRLFAKQKQSHIQHKLMVTKREGEEND